MFAISCFTSHTFNIEIYLHSNILRSQAKRSEITTAWNIPRSSEGSVALLSVTLRWGVRSFFLLKGQGGPTLFFGKKYQNSSATPLQEETYLNSLRSMRATLHRASSSRCNFGIRSLSRENSDLLSPADQHYREVPSLTNTFVYSCGNRESLRRKINFVSTGLNCCKSETVNQKA